jgi:hypothetical protein
MAPGIRGGVPMRDGRRNARLERMPGIMGLHPAAEGLAGAGK